MNDAADRPAPLVPECPIYMDLIFRGPAWPGYKPIEVGKFDADWKVEADIAIPLPLTATPYDNDDVLALIARFARWFARLVAPRLVDRVTGKTCYAVAGYVMRVGEVPFQKKVVPIKFLEPGDNLVIPVRLIIDHDITREILSAATRGLPIDHLAVEVAP